MSKHNCQLNIAGVNLKISTPFLCEVGERCKPFISISEAEDLRLEYQIGLPNYQGEKLVKDRSPRIWEGEDYYRVERSFIQPSEPITAFFIPKRNLDQAEGYIRPGYEERFIEMTKLLNISELETLMAGRGIVSLHSSLVRYQDSAILFTAPSGTGKTTQAELWEKHRGAEQLNGDRSFIRKKGKGWFAYGSPFAGNSGIYRNEFAPIRAIVVLRQAQENAIKHISKSEAFRCLYSETVIPLWNDSAHTQIVDILTAIVSELPVFMFFSTPDERAVNRLDRYLLEEGI